MSKIALNPYLAFPGTAKDAMNFYHKVFGGKLDMQTFEESGAMQVDDADKDKIIHAVLESNEIIFMASDGTSNRPVKMGDNISMSLSGSDEENLTKYFNELSVGGKITMPLEKAPWGDTFGMFTDKFGINWMVNISSK